MQQKLLKSFLAVIIAAFAGSAFAAGAPSGKSSVTGASDPQQQEPDCTKYPRDPRCKDK